MTISPTQQVINILKHYELFMAFYFAGEDIDIEAPEWVPGGGLDLRFNTAYCKLREVNLLGPRLPLLEKIYEKVKKRNTNYSDVRAWMDEQRIIKENVRKLRREHGEIVLAAGELAAFDQLVGIYFYMRDRNNRQAIDADVGTIAKASYDIASQSPHIKLEQVLYDGITELIPIKMLWQLS